MTAVDGDWRGRSWLRDQAMKTDCRYAKDDDEMSL